MFLGTLHGDLRSLPVELAQFLQVTQEAVMAVVT
jgi:hypothetical protein